MKTILYLLISIFMVCAMVVKADDYVWGERFKEGDILSAETFNQIFDSIQTLNRRVVDSDLVGTWSCASVWAGTGSSAGLTQDTTNTWLFSLENAQLNMTASAQSTSFPSGYSFSTSAPNPFVSNSSVTAVSGTYVLFNNTMLSKGILTGNNIISHNVKLVSDTRIIFSTINTSSNLAKVIVCDVANPAPAAPTATTATNSQTAINLSWTDQSNDETGFKLYRRLTSETEATQLATAVATNSYVDGTLIEGQRAYYSVSAYNSDGESKRSKVASASLDSIAPTVTSHNPTKDQQNVSLDASTLSITFSESIRVKCPADGKLLEIVSECPTDGEGAITAVGSSGTNYTPRSEIRGQGLILTGNLTERGSMEANDTITVTVHREWIEDLNGVEMAADYDFTFTTASE